MTALKELLEQRDAIERQIDAARGRDIAKAIEAALVILDQHGLDPSDLGFVNTRGGGLAAPKYINRETGETWSGLGRAPVWMAGKDRRKFEVQYVTE